MKLKNFQRVQAIKKAGKYYVDGNLLDKDLILSNNFLKSDFAQIPAGCYVTNVSYSIASIQWLEWQSYIRNINIKHALNGKGEVKIDIISTNFIITNTKVLC